MLLQFNKVILFYWIFNLGLTAFTPVLCQNMIIVEKPGTIDNIKFFEGSYIHLKWERKTIKTKEKGIITGIFDSTLIIDGYKELVISDITAVYLERRIVKLAGNVAVISGIGFFVLDSFNRLINNEAPVIQNRTLKTSSIVAGAGLITFPLHKRRFGIGKKWRIKVLISDDSW